MRKFEVGDRVVVRKNFWDDTSSKYVDHVGINYNMKPYSGQIARIVRYWPARNLEGERLYNIDIDNRMYAWVSDWLQYAKVEVKEGDNL